MTALVAMLLAQLGDPCGGGDEARPFAKCFDPGRGIELSVGGSEQSLNAGADVTLGARWRGEKDSKSKRGTTWLMGHHFAFGETRLSPTERHLTLTAYEVIARRHVDDGSLVLPTNPPVRLPFPFDLGLYGRAVRYERRVEDGNGWVLETARLGLMVDPLHSASGRFHLGIGPTLAHQLRFDGKTFANEITPLTALQVFVNAESADGLWVVRLDGWAGWTVTPSGNAVSFVPRARGEVSVERVLFAINDQPVSVALRAAGAYREAGALAQNEWTAGAALKLQLFAH